MKGYIKQKKIYVRLAHIKHSFLLNFFHELLVDIREMKCFLMNIYSHCLNLSLIF